MKNEELTKRHFNRHSCNIFIEVLFLLILVTQTTNGPVQAQEKEITVSAAISLKEAFAELGKTFEGEQKGARVQFNFGASGDLVRQILAGAPVDVLASAGLKEMDELEQKGFTAPGTRVNFAGNTVVLAVPPASTFRLEAFSDLTRKEVKKIAIGNPQTVPAGRYAEQVLRNLKLWEPLKDKLVFAENVRQVLNYEYRSKVFAWLRSLKKKRSQSKVKVCRPKTKERDRDGTRHKYNTSV